MAGSRFREGWREESSVISMAVSTVRVIIGNNVPGWREIARKNTRDTGLEARWLRPRPSADLEQGNRNLTGAPRQGEPESRDRLFVPTLSLSLCCIDRPVSVWSCLLNIRGGGRLRQADWEIFVSIERFEEGGSYFRWENRRGKVKF